MSSQNEDERCPIRQTMDMHAIRVRHRLDKGTPIFLVFGDLASDADKNGLVETLGRAVFLRLVCCRRELFYSKECAHFCEELTFYGPLAHPVLYTSVPADRHRPPICKNWGPMSVNRYAGAQYGMSQWPIFRFAMCVAFLFDVRTAHVNFEQRSVMTRMY